MAELNPGPHSLFLLHPAGHEWTNSLAFDPLIPQENSKIGSRNSILRGPENMSMGRNNKH
jgi:hypothetical protein